MVCKMSKQKATVLQKAQWCCTGLGALCTKLDKQFSHLNILNEKHCVWTEPFPSVKHGGGSVMGLLAASGSGQFLIKATMNS